MPSQELAFLLKILDIIFKDSKSLLAKSKRTIIEETFNKNASLTTHKNALVLSFLQLNYFIEDGTDGFLEEHGLLDEANELVTLAQPVSYLTLAELDILENHVVKFFKKEYKDLEQLVRKLNKSFAKRGIKDNTYLQVDVFTDRLFVHIVANDKRIEQHMFNVHNYIGVKYV